LIATESAAHVVLAAAVLDAMVAHAREDAPDECCGLLVGSANRIDEAVRTRSLERSPNRYQVDPAAHFALIRRLRGTDRAIIGAYHSHPRSAAEPSPSDLREAYDSELVYVIVSLAGVEPEVRAWKIAEGVVVELRIRQA
jgi:[CysO sulfur-carrier protein]-S-L-cysteine hydrolase